MLMKRVLLGLATLMAVLVVSAKAQTWRQVGPPGGTVISLAADPTNIKSLEPNARSASASKGPGMR